MNGKTICHPPGAIDPRDIVVAIQRFGDLHPTRRNALSNEDLYQALIAQWPCPFDPVGKGAKPVSQDDLTGVWQLAGDSRAENPAVMKPDPYPVDCAAIAFAEGGRLDTFVLHNTLPCPTIHAADFSARTSLPKTIDWSFDTPNVLTITRPNQPLFVEVWHVWLVDQPFDHGSAHYDAGDLLMYLKRYNDSDGQGITLYFRHMHRAAID